MDLAAASVFEVVGRRAFAVLLTFGSMLDVLEDTGQHSNETGAESLNSAGGGAAAGSEAASWGRSRRQHGQ